MKKRLISIILLIIMLTAIFTSCSNNSGDNSSSTQNEADSQSVTIALDSGSEPASGFDPSYGWGAGEHVHEPLIQSTLTVTTPDLKIDFDLATEMNVSEDGMLWTVKIRNDVKFTDGENLTADDVAFTYNTLKENSSVNDFTMLNTAVAIDDNTIEFKMNKPYSIWPYTMAIVGIIPEHAYGKDYGENPIGSGRYILKQWDRGQQVILEANPNYYGDEIKMKTVNIVFMSEDTAFSAAKSGQVDLVFSSATFSNEKIEGYQLLSYETVDNRAFNLPTANNPVTSDIAVRKAMNIGIDRDEMIDNVLNGYGKPAYSVCDNMPWYNNDSEVKYDFDAGIKLLEDANWVVGSDGIRSKGSTRASLKLMFPTGDSIREALCHDTANQLRLLGIEAIVEGVGWDSAYDRAQTDLLNWGWGAHTPMELYNIYHSMPQTGTAEFSPYANQKVDEYMDAALQSSNLEESYKLWQQAQWDGEQGIIADVPWIWLVNIDHLYFANEKLEVAQQKLHPHGHGWSIVNNVDQWDWKTN